MARNLSILFLLTAATGLRAQTTNATTHPGAVPAKPTPVFTIRAYEFDTDTVLPSEKIKAILTNYTGNVDLPRLHAGLNRLQSYYSFYGYTNLVVTLPEQSLTNGVLHLSLLPREAALALTKPKPKLAVRGYDVRGNTVLAPSDFGMLTNFTGTNIDFAQLRDGLGKLQLRYRELGYSTINVTLPQQRLTNGVVQVKVVEGRLSDITVSGNRWFSTANVRRALPSLTTNVLLNEKWFQPELDQANANRDRQIYPVVSPGPDPGTTVLDLKVKDRIPLHGRMEINDKSTPDSPLLRLDTALQYDNLWQHEHQIGVDYDFSPQQMKNGNTHGFYDQPLVTSYSAFYRLPLGADDGEREELEKHPANFGFDEVTHKFNLPPPTGHPSLVLYASRSVSDTPVRYGPLSVIFTNTLANIGSQSAQAGEVIDDNLGAKLVFPLPEFAAVRSSFSIGADFKSYEAPSFSTNLTYFSLYALDTFGNPILVTNTSIQLPSNTRTELNYIPLSFGWSGARPDSWGSFAFSYEQSVFLQSLASSRTNFQVVAGAPGAGGNYTTINAGLSRLQKLPAGWSALANLNGQWSSAPLISNEEFALGGTSGVRGYQQGEIYGDNGWRGLFDFRAPPVRVGYFPTTTGDIPAELYLSCFMDYGKAYLIDRPVVGSLTFTEWGTGLGAYLVVGEHFDARLTIAWALENTPTSGAGSAQAYFSIGSQF
jgi:hemolysin activation/secretion protein